jgi:hypothetical protein
MPVIIRRQFTVEDKHLRSGQSESSIYLPAYALMAGFAFRNLP